MFNSYFLANFKYSRLDTYGKFWSLFHHFTRDFVSLYLHLILPSYNTSAEPWTKQMHVADPTPKLVFWYFKNYVRRQLEIKLGQSQRSGKTAKVWQAHQGFARETQFWMKVTWFLALGDFQHIEEKSESPGKDTANSWIDGLSTAKEATQEPNAIVMHPI